MNEASAGNTSSSLSGEMERLAGVAADSQRQRRMYETVLASTPDFVYVFSLDHKVLYANESLINMWGRGREGAIGKTFLEIGYEPWHAEMHCREIDQVRSTRQPIRGEVPFNGANGRRIYDYIFVPIFGADGEVEAVAGTTRDVTERKEAEEQLRAGEARQAYLVRLADTLRKLSEPVEVQAEASRLLGEHLGANRVVYFEIQGEEYVIARDYTRGVQPLAGRYPVAAFGRDLLAALRDGRTLVEADATTVPDRPASERAAFAGIQVCGHVDVPLAKAGRFVAGMTVQTSDRREWTAPEIALIEDTAERTWAAMERVRAEAALRASEEGRRLALDAAELGAFNIDLATSVIHTDERFRIIFTGNTEAMDYKQAFAAIHPEDVERVRLAVAAATRTDNPAPYTEEYRVVHPDGSVHWVFAKGRGNFDPAGTGRLLTFDGTVADITARKQAEAALKEADRRKDQFLATLAHELRNPLAPIRSGLQVVRLAAAEGIVAQNVAMMERQLGQMVRLVDDLLDVSRLTTGKLELLTQRLQLADVISAALETSRPVIEQHGQRLSVSLPDEPVFVDGDPMRLAQVVSNLLTNAAKYTHEGGNIQVSVSLDGGQARVAVADNGIGIPPAMLDAVFDMFTQVDRSLEKTTGGLGIGLSLVKGIVEMHGGTIAARSDGEGQGSVFEVRLPLATSAAGALETGAPEANPARPAVSHRILIVDDNVDAANSLAQLLEMMNHEVRTAYDGESGIEAGRAFRPGVVLCDIGMPKMNGYDTVSNMRAEEWGRNAVYVALTGFGTEDDLRRSAHAGFDHHVVKPVDVNALIALLTNVRPLTR